jgi:hypothetical protein
MIIRALIAAGISLAGAGASAKDLTHRLGIGFSENSSINLPSLAAKYYVSPDIALGANLGVDTQNDESRFAAAARVYKTIFVEDNLNFYGGASVGSVSHEESGSNISGFELSGFFGCEFFFTGLESLGFSFEAGVGVTNDSTGTRFRTIGDTPFRAGMLFYF